jgi:hypothetical protein
MFDTDCLHGETIGCHFGLPLVQAPNSIEEAEALAERLAMLVAVRIAFMCAHQRGSICGSQNGFKPFSIPSAATFTSSFPVIIAAMTSRTPAYATKAP